MATSKRYTGSAWTDLTTSKRYTGSAHVDLTFGRRWTGSVWEEVLRDPTTITSFSSLETGSWRSVSPYYYWGDQQRPVQGQWESQYGYHAGFWFYNYSTLQSTLAGRVIDKVEIYLSRRNDMGYSAAQSLTLRMHSYATYSAVPLTSSLPAMGDNQGSIGSLAWGEAKWFTLSNTVGELLRDNARKGVCIYNGTGPYVGLYGRANQSTSGRLRITHS